MREKLESPGAPAARAAGFNGILLQPHLRSYVDSCSTGLACQPACTARALEPRARPPLRSNPDNRLTKRPLC